MKKKLDLINIYKYDYSVLLIFFAYFFPLLFSPNEARFLVHDNLDGMIPLYSFMGETNIFFARPDELVKGIFDEIPRAFLPSKYSFFRILFLIFPALIAYIIHFIFVHLVAYLGLRFLLKDFIIKGNKILYTFIPLSFAFLPFWPSGELTVAGLPLLIWCLLKVFKNQSRYIHWILILLFPIFSSMPFGNMFSFPVLFLFYLIGCYKQKHWKFDLKHMMPFLLLIISTVISEYDMFKLILNGIETNRSASFGESSLLNFKGMIGVSVLAFLFGHYHYHSFHLLILIAIFISSVIFLIKKDYYNLKRISVMSLILFGLYLITIIANNINLTGDFKMSIRFWVLFPSIWFILFAYIINIGFSKKIQILAVITQIIWVMFLVYPKDYYGSKYLENPFFYSLIDKTSDEQSSFKDYYDEEEFNSIKTQFPELLNNNVMSVGFIPGKTLFNKINSYDAYVNIYPKEKWEIIKLINMTEYKKNNLNYYSNNRAYLFSSDIENGKDTIKPIWNFNGLKKANVNYIISTKAIIGNFVLLGKSKKYYVYKINFIPTP